MSDPQRPRLPARFTGARPRPSRRDLLVAAARRDAERRTPAFSELLHARVMAAVRAEAEREADPLTLRPARRPWRLAPLAAAAAVALTVGSFWYARHVTPRSDLTKDTGTRPPATAPSTEPAPAVAPSQVALVPSFQSAVDRVSAGEAALEADLGPGQWAGLSHDARVAVRFVLGPLPMKPPKAVDDWVR